MKHMFSLSASDMLELVQMVRLAQNMLREDETDEYVVLQILISDVLDGIHVDEGICNGIVDEDVAKALVKVIDNHLRLVNQHNGPDEEKVKWGHLVTLFK